MNESVWVLIAEDGDGEWWGFMGVFKSPEAGLEFAKIIRERDDLVLNPNISRDREGKEFTVENSFAIQWKPGEHFITAYYLEKVEVK